jgi:hypothetical protein
LEATLKQIWDRLDKNSDALQTILLTITIVFAGIALFYNAITIREGNRIAWRTFLDTRSTDLNKEELDHDMLHCVYYYNIEKIDSDCLDRAYTKQNLPIILDYTHDFLEHLREVREYSNQEDKDYYTTWYGKTADNLSDDPTGVVSFVLWNDFDCTKETTSHNCDYANVIGICIKSDAFVQDKEKCFENLKSRREKFLSGVGKKQ